MENQKNILELGFDLKKLQIPDDDLVVKKFLMLIEGIYGIGVQASIKKYGYSEQRYYQLLKGFRQEGIQALINEKTGPKKNSKRTDKVNQQIIRYRFLDPDCSAGVISQKLKQQGISISERSVARTIKDYGLQKKTLSTKS